MKFISGIHLIRFSALIAVASACVAETVSTSGKPPAWSSEIAPIIHANCVECHRPEEVGPFDLITFEDVAKRAGFVLEAVESGFMPPWPPENDGNRFHGRRELSAAELQRLREWVQSGTPRGEDEAPAPPEFPPSGWKLGVPDLVVSMPEPFLISAENRDVYRAFVIPYNLTSIDRRKLGIAHIPGSRQVGASVVEVRPGNRRVLHHVILYVDTSGKARELDMADPGPGYETFGDPQFEPAAYLGSWVPGAEPVPLPPGVAEAIPLKGDLVVLSHYKPTGKPETDQSRYGIHISDTPVMRVTSALRLGSFDISIPPGVSDHTLRDRFEVPADCYLIAVFPHMHYLGKSHQMRITFPDGQRESFLEIPDWDFNWQKRYLLREPLLLPKGTVLHAEWVFDNSAANPSNPHNPPRRVSYGPGSGDEMCELNIEVIPVDLADYATLRAAMEAHVRGLLEKRP